LRVGFPIRNLHSTDKRQSRYSRPTPIMSNLLSTKPIPPAERLIFALDVPTAEEAKVLVEQLGDAVLFYKIGLELFMAGGYFELIDWLAARGKKIFVDLKFFDVPETVKRAVAALQGRPVEFTTVHGNQGIMEAAVAAASGVKVLAVTVLKCFEGRRRHPFPEHVGDVAIAEDVGIGERLRGIDGDRYDD